jgi:hypothetical protein
LFDGPQDSSKIELTYFQLYGILEYRNTQANMAFTKKAQESTQKAQESADRMEQITADMHKIAKKTERETLSMGIITFVTLVFLPGTFMSVSSLILHISNLNKIPVVLI